MKILDIKPKNLVLGEVFDDFSNATTKVDYNIEDLCAYIISVTNNYYWLNLESIWGQIGWKWEKYNEYGYFSKSNVPYKQIPVIPDTYRIKSFYKLLYGITGDVEVLKSDFNINALAPTANNTQYEVIWNFPIKIVFGRTHHIYDFRFSLQDIILLPKYEDNNYVGSAYNYFNGGIVINKDNYKYFPINIDYNAEYDKYYVLLSASYHNTLCIKIDKDLPDYNINNYIKSINNGPIFTKYVYYIPNINDTIIIPIFDIGKLCYTTGLINKINLFNYEFNKYEPNENYKFNICFDCSNFKDNNNYFGGEIKRQIELFTAQTQYKSITYKNTNNLPDNIIKKLYYNLENDVNTKITFNKELCRICETLGDNIIIHVNSENLNDWISAINVNKLTDYRDITFKIYTNEPSHANVAEYGYDYREYAINIYYNDTTKKCYIPTIQFITNNGNIINPMISLTNVDDNTKIYINNDSFKSDLCLSINNNQQLYVSNSVNLINIAINIINRINSAIIIDNSVNKNIKFDLGTLYNSNFISSEDLNYNNDIIYNYLTNYEFIDIVDKNIESIKQLSINTLIKVSYTKKQIITKQSLYCINSSCYMTNYRDDYYEIFMVNDNSNIIFYNSELRISDKINYITNEYVTRLINSFIFDDNDKATKKNISLQSDYFNLITEEQKLTFIEHNYDLVEIIN